MRRLSLDAIIFCNKFMFPKRRFGKAESILERIFKASIKLRNFRTPLKEHS